MGGEDEEPSAKDQAKQPDHEPKPDTAPNPEQRPSLLPRSSLESTATTLPAYTAHPDQPPGYNTNNTATTTKPHATKPSASRNPPGPNASAVSALMAPPSSSSSTDKMHTPRSTRQSRVDDWSREGTYKSKLARMTGSKGNWNYFGADIQEEGRGFRSLVRKKK